MLNTPLGGSVQILDVNGNVEVDLDLVEHHHGGPDGDASKYGDAVPTFHGLSRAGDVVGTIIEGGYCTKQEFDSFAEKGISFEGSIVLCRYGGNFRGLKVKGAQEAGAAGVLIFSDVNDDGTVTEANGYAAYPLGPARNPNSVQRGGVQFVSMYPGDPTTPGYPSYENSTRTEGENIPAIPSLPLSWNNAKILFRTLNGSDSLYGKRVRLFNNVNTTVTPIWNTLAVIPGHITDEVVVIGNHRDAWVLGATDPISGMVSVQELVRGLGHLLKKGWKPLRTILIASWDAEEHGLIGSTEWGEDFTEWIHEHVVAYLNLDSSASGSRLRFSASPLLAHLIRRTAEELPHPVDKDRALWDATTDDGTLFGINGTVNLQSVAIKAMELSAVDGVGVTPLGSGSDYTVFLQRIGVPSTNGGFGSTFHDPVYHYHSVFDTERWQELYGDPGFHRHIAVTKHLGLQALRISGSVVLPLNTTHYTTELKGYLSRVEQLSSEASLDISFSKLRKSIQSLHKASLSLDHEKEKAEKSLRRTMEKWHKKQEKRRRQLRRKLRKVICRVRSGLGDGWKCKEWSPVAREDRELFMIAAHIGFEGDVEPGNFLFGGSEFPWKKVRKAVKRIQEVNKKLIAFERGFISKGGIKDREWFKHLGVAPGKWLGYGATTFPALTEAITFERNATLAKHESERLIELFDRLSDVISA
ncbi:hypothetical protein EST38_g3913 [Candolleomyces aberdarensis]|uniref:Zn-dependent exopeptidase n=1 Tax=Candolleomyces aberdarensis TaxID=2316362 RepID=A0A4V1Q4G1_9AGAR|nr:hypothetical protein EST38_g3913 [Candolleomyces aberdarensis]